jgi:hypothetical protein
MAAYWILPAVWRHHEHRHPALGAAPRVTLTADGVPGDPLNVALVGKREDVVGAMLAAGWFPADPKTFHTASLIVKDVLLNRPYPQAPVSDLYVWGKQQELAFEQPISRSPRQRHHVRFWRSPETDASDRPLWMGAATLDTRVGISHLTGQITHHIEANVDAERDKVLRDLDRAGWLAEWYSEPGLGPTRSGRNGGGDPYVTDGNIAVGVLAPPRAPRSQPASAPED